MTPRGVAETMSREYPIERLFAKNSPLIRPEVDHDLPSVGDRVDRAHEVHGHADRAGEVVRGAEGQDAEHDLAPGHGREHGPDRAVSAADDHEGHVVVDRRPDPLERLFGPVDQVLPDEADPLLLEELARCEEEALSAPGAGPDDEDGPHRFALRTRLGHITSNAMRTG